MKRRKSNVKWLIILLAGVLIVGSAFLYLESERSAPADSQATERFFSPPVFKVPDGEIGCRKLVGQYCSKLYSNEARGNLRVSDGKKEFLTLQGKTRNNFDNAWFAFYRARLDRRSRLPQDLRRALATRDFFSKLEKILNRPSRGQLELEQGIRFNELEEAVDQAWDRAIDETIAKRLERKFPGIHKLADEDMPQEAEYERWRIRYRLWSEISVALWSGSARWLAVQADFGRLKESFRTSINLRVADEPLRKAWLYKLERVKLTLPGHNPITANDDCISSSRNAYYYPYLNTLTVCAGYFNGGEQIQTLAHELSHAFDYNSRLIDFQQSSRFSRSLRELRANVCVPKDFRCGKWESFKADFEQELSELEGYSGELLPFHQCLQKTKPEKVITDEVRKEKSTKLVKYRFSDLTKNSALFRITSPNLPLASGLVIKNPNHLNPCSYHLWNQDPFPLDSELASLLFFTAAYQCEAKVAENPVRRAVEISSQMTERLFEVALKNEGEFSSRQELQVESYSSPPIERFADRFGSYAVAEYLKRYASVSEKRTRYLVSSFWLCDKPSLKLSNYKNIQALADFIIDKTVHPENEERMKDWLSPPVREQLACESDFEHSECAL